MALPGLGCSLGDTMKIDKKMANIIRGSALFAAVVIGIYTWMTTPLVIYGFLGLFTVGLVYGGYMNRTYIRSEVDRVIGEWKVKQENE